MASAKVGNMPIQSLNVLRVVVGALFMGMTLAALLFAALRITGRTPPIAPSIDPMTFAAILGALAIVVTLLQLVIPPMIVRKAAARYREAPEGERDGVVLQTLATSTIMRCSMVEGVGLFGTVAFYITGMWPLLAAPALAALVIAAFFPTEGKLRALRERLENAAQRV